MNISESIIAALIIATITYDPIQFDELMDTIHPEYDNLFYFDNSLEVSESSGIFSLNDGDKTDPIWSHEYEKYVHQSDLSIKNNINNSQLVNRYLESNPSAAGNQKTSVIKKRFDFYYSDRK